MTPQRFGRLVVSPLGISTRRLTSRPVVLRDATLSNVTLVPLFNAAGTTVKVAILSPRTRDCWVLDWRAGLVRIPLFRKTRVDILRAQRQSVMAAGTLWLHDPSGLMEIALTTLCPALSVRNATDVLPPGVQRLTWWRDLSRISGVWKWEKGSYDAVKWEPQWLSDADKQPTIPAPAPRPVADRTPNARAPGGWVLAPMWAR